MLSDKINALMVSRTRVKGRREFDDELQVARLKGYHVPALDFDRLVATDEQAEKALQALGIDPECDFYAAMKGFRNFPPGQGDELYALDEIVDPATLTYWDDEYPQLSKDYLRITSIEGEGSYFYRKSTGEVYDAGWGDMSDLAAGKLRPRWHSFAEFLDWYYEEF